MTIEWIVGISLFFALILIGVLNAHTNKNQKVEEEKPITCPECGATKTRYLSITEAPFQRFSTPMQCINMHVFNAPKGCGRYEDGYMYE